MAKIETPNEQPIEEVLDDILPEWRHLTAKMKAEGATEEEIVAELRRRMHVELDSLMDLYNDLGGA